MRVTIRSLIILGVTYGVGYFHGARDSDKVGEGLKNVGEGLKEMAKEMGVELAMRMKEEDSIDVEPIDDVTAEQVGEIRLMAQGGVRTDKEIADRMGVSEATVRKVLSDETTADKVRQMDRDRASHPRSDEEIAEEVGITVLEVRDILAGGERPTDPGSDPV